MSTIEAQVAAIFDDRRIAINVGALQGVTASAPLTVWRRVFVKDPDTGEVLGHVDLDALTMRVVDVQERISVATVPTGTINLFNFSFATSGKRIRGGGSEEDERTVRISVGDRVTVQVPDDDDEEAHGQEPAAPRA